MAAQHKELQQHVSRLRRVLTVTVLALIFLFLVAAKARVDAIPGDEVTAALEKRADIIANKLTDAAGDVLDEAGPVIGEAVGKEASVAIEDMQRRLDKDMADLEKTVTQQFRTAYQHEVEQVGVQGAKILQESFPQLKDDPKKTEALLANFQDGVQMWAQKQLVTTFKRHIDAMFRIKRTLNKLVSGGPKGVDLADHVTGDGAKVAAAKIQPERLLEMWIELVSDALGGSEDEGDLLDETAASKAKAKAAAAEASETVKPEKPVAEEKPATPEPTK